MDISTTIGIIGVFITVILWYFSKENLINFFQQQSIFSYVEKLHLRSDFRIGIIDDEINGYPIEYIENLGFIVKTYESVSFSDSDTLAKHDILLLDVKGVVKEDLDEGGAKLIKIIKEKRPLLPIIAVSSGYFHAELNDYFKISDSTVNKPIDEYKIRELLHEIKKEFFDAIVIVKLIERCISQLDISSSKKKKITKSVIDFISKKSNENDFLNLIHENAKCESQQIIINSKVLLDRIKYD